MKKRSALMLILSFSLYAGAAVDDQVRDDSDSAGATAAEFMDYNSSCDDDWDRASDGPGQIIPYGYDRLGDGEKAWFLISSLNGALEAQRDDALSSNAVRHTFAIVYEHALDLSCPVWVAQVLQELLNALSGHYQIIYRNPEDILALRAEYAVCSVLQCRWAKKLQAMRRLQRNLA